MGKKLIVVGVLMALVFLAGETYAESPFAFLKGWTENEADGSIVVISKEETSLPGYFHEKYVYTDLACFGDVHVDHYGPAIDPNDASLLRLEHRLCMEDHDGESDSSDS